MTIPYKIEPWHLIVPWPKEESRLLATIRPFQLPVIWPEIEDDENTLYIGLYFRFG